ncbi:MAG: restriction endonuclease [Caldilineae bacterium]|nr:MAG: restriction endonuclease [Caldilineae bacterium]
MPASPFHRHLRSAHSLVTPYEQTRSGFITLALEKNRRATPYVNEARVLKSLASRAEKPDDLLDFTDIRPSLLAAAGVSDKAAGHLTDADKTKAILGLIEKFLKPAGTSFVDELVFRFLLTRGDSLGGKMRNLAGILAEQKLSRTLIATLSLAGRPYEWLDAVSKKWFSGHRDEVDVETRLRGLSWQNQNGQDRVLIYNLKVPIVNKNVDLCLFDAHSSEFILGRKKELSCHYQPARYLALGELKGGIDPAGADEHWKTANSALERIRIAFADQNLSPHTFFIGAAIENSMAEEIYAQLEQGTMNNAANLTDDNQLASICQWLVNL